MVSVGNFFLQDLARGSWRSLLYERDWLSKMAVATENIDTRADVSAC